MGKTIKIIDKVYEVRQDGKNCLYVNQTYSEIVFVDGFKRTAVKVHGEGLDLYRISNKLQRRFYHFLKNGFSIYANGIYVYSRHFT